jgi:hypothetical protein
MLLRHPTPSIAKPLDEPYAWLMRNLDMTVTSNGFVLELEFPNDDHVPRRSRALRRAEGSTASRPTPC